MFLIQKGEKSLIFEIAFIDQVQWSGAKTRSVQLYELFENQGYSLKRIEPVDRPGKWTLLRWALKGVLKFGLYKPYCMSGLRTLGYTYFKFSYYAKKYNAVDTFIIEGTGFGALQCVSILKSLDLKVILIPANVESLVPYSSSTAWTHSLPPVIRLKEELKYYLKADAIFCISLEETWLLNTLGAKAYFLPYYPPKILLKKIQLRKRKRLHSIKSGLLYFANFNNIPNYLGFKKFIEDQLNTEKPIRVAGIGIEKITPLVQENASFIILGELSDDALEEELIACEKVILNHFPTSGMLTRVPELLLSGIPIMGNDAAMKAYSMLPTTEENFDLSHFLRQQVDTSVQKLFALV